MIRIQRTILKIDSQLRKNASQTAIRTRLIRALFNVTGNSVSVRCRQFYTILNPSKTVEEQWLFCDNQGRIYYEANEASDSGPHHLGGPHQNFNAVSKADFFIS